jgi:Na+-transporting methylmalonyl-CoA/oxaloacetate decarboxylase gamma subunit
VSDDDGRPSADDSQEVVDVVLEATVQRQGRARPVIAAAVVHHRVEVVESA